MLIAPRRPAARASSMSRVDEFLVLVVHRDRQAGARDLGKAAHGRVVDAGEPFRIVLVGGQLERGHAAGGEPGDRRHAAGAADGPVERDVDMRGAVHDQAIFRPSTRHP